MKPVIKNIVVCAALLASVTFLPAPAPAFMGDGAPPAAHHFRKMAKKLQLTPEQTGQISDIFAKNKPVSEPLIKQIKSERRTLRALIQADTLDEVAIRAQSTKVGAIEADLAVQRAKLAQEIRGVLTPEQVAKAKQLQAQHDKRMEEGFARGGKRMKREY